MPDLTEQFATVLVEQRLLPKGRPVVVAVSGGRDSMVLLHLMNAVGAGFKWKLHVAHFNHRLRGRASLEDERFVRRQAGSLGLPFHSARWDEKEKRRLIKAHGVEMAAREARLKFLGDTARSVKSKHIALAHHADDQAELFFIRLLRGSGSQGLGGMRSKSSVKPPVSGSLIRPLLQFARSDLAAWAIAHDVKYREDSSNTDHRHVRNRVRHHLIPFLEADFSSAISATIGQTMRILSDEADWWRTEAGKALRDTSLKFDCLPVPLQRHVVVVQLEQLGVGFDFESVERLRRSADSVINVRGNRFLSRATNGRIVERWKDDPGFVADRTVLKLETAQGQIDFGGRLFAWSVRSITSDTKIERGPNIEMFDLGKLAGSIALRHWRAGDRFQPIGMKEPCKLQDLFTNAKVPGAVRRSRVVAETGSGDIFWVEGLRIGEVAKVTSRTIRCLEWRRVEEGPDG